MKLAIIGLGRMGANMARRLSRAGHEVVAYNRTQAVTEALAAEESHITVATSLADALGKLELPRVVWLMLPHQILDNTIAELQQQGLVKGDLVIDGGNSNFNLSMARGKALQEAGIEFVDVGTSGGVWGLENGYSMMVGGSATAVERLTPALQSLAPTPETGWGHVGPVGSGHFTKMVHNGIEYGMMQAYAEGYELLQAREAFHLDLEQISKIWQHGSVVRSWLLDLCTDALGRDPHLEKLSDWVDDSGEGRWTVQESIDSAVPTPVLTLALMMRFRSRQESSFAGRMLAAMRAGFGGHAVKKAEGE
ncbi:MAG: decarboxylating 6-phosphogluconate dehydrogenase [Gammaproteobacteria bacterium]|nr:decarboxylating 6-phosphogluconate dehydrogenase [Gammaproteobacteria bacterium]